MHTTLKRSLKKAINEKRKELHELLEKVDKNPKEILSLSKELDELIYRYYRACKK